MQKTKKVLSVVLSVIMLFSVFTCSISAAVPSIEGSATQGVLFEYLDENGNAVTSVNPGQVITVNIYATVNAANEALKAAKFQIWFNSAIYEYVADSQAWVGPADYLDSGSMTEVITSGTVYTNVYNKLTTDEQAYGWDSALYMQFVLDKTVAGSYLVQENAATPFATAQFKVKDTVAPGTAAPIGAPQATTYVKRGAVYNYVQTTNVAVPTASGKITLATPGTSFTVVSAAPELAVTALANQIRYNKNDDDSFKDINVRARASINAAELQALVGATANDDVERKIVDAGFVFGPTLDLATAKTVAEGATVEGYTKKPVEYIQNDGTSYIYTCLVDGLTDDKIVAENDFDVLAYIALDIDGTTYYFYFEGVKDVSPVGMYNATYERANTTFGWSLAAK